MSGGRFNLDDYVTVDERIDKFWADYPDGAILTEVVWVSDDGLSVAIRATVYQDRLGPVVATGIAQEERGPSGANKSSWWENGETSSIGRALANMGMTLSRNRASREEMRKVERGEGAERDDTRVAYADHGADPTPYRPGAALAAEHNARRPVVAVASTAEDYTIERALAVARDPDEGARRERAARWAINQADSEAELMAIATAVRSALPDGRLYADTLRRKRAALSAAERVADPGESAGAEA